MTAARDYALKLFLECREGKHKDLYWSSGKLRKRAFGMRVTDKKKMPKNPETVNGWVAKWEAQLADGETPNNESSDVKIRGKKTLSTSRTTPQA